MGRKRGDKRNAFPNTLVQLFCLSWSGLIGTRYEHGEEKKRLILLIGIGDSQ